MDELNVLGLDGSLANFGMVVGTVDMETGSLVSIKTMILSETEKDKTKGVKRADDDLARFKQHWDFIKNTIETYHIGIAFGEVPTGAQDARAAFAFGGVTALLAALPVPLVGLTPLQVKEGSTGLKYADKEDIIEWAYGKFPKADWFTGKRPNKMNIKTPEGLYLGNKNEHLADSVACIATGLKHKGFAEFRKSYNSF